MKILYDYQIFTEQKYGGVSRYHFELAKNINLIEAKKDTVKIISPLYRNHYLNEKNINFSFKGHKFPDFSKFVKLSSIINSFFFPILSWYFNPNIIHQTYYNTSKYLPSRAKKIITIHDMVHELFPNQFLKNDKTTKLKKKALEEADHIICVSKNTQDDLINLFNINAEKTTVIYHGLSLGQQVIRYPKKAKKPYLLYVGKREGYKNFKRFIEAYSSNKIKNFYDIVIFGGGKMSKDEIEMFNKLEIPKTSFKQIDGNDSLLAGYYKNASLFVYPSLYEGFGIPPLEAMSFGCPVVCSNTSSIPEVVGDAALLFNPYSVESIRENIICALYNEKIKLSLIAKGQKRVKKFTWKKCAEQTYKVYEKVLS